MKNKIQIIPVKPGVKGNRKLLEEFIHLPAKLHSGNPCWMPTIYADDRKFFNPLKNHSFDFCDTTMALAVVDGKVSGRIMGIIHNKYNELRNEGNARFGYFDAINNQDIAHALIEYITVWSRSHGKNILVGPYGFSDKDVQGLLVDGFDKLPLIDSACNPPYIAELIENEGFSKEIDCMTYKFPVLMALPELYYRVRERYSAPGIIKLIEFTNRKQLQPYIIPVLQLVNRTYDHLYGFVPMTDTEIQELANRYLPIIDPRFVKVIEKEGEIVAFVVAVPNFTRGIQKSRGHLFPFGILHILNAIRKSKQLDLMLGAVKRELQNSGLEVIMGMSLIESAKQGGFTDMEAHLILETNKKMRAEMERLGIPVYKRFRVYRKEIG